MVLAINMLPPIYDFLVLNAELHKECVKLKKK
jgi:hypothetical protein